MQGILFDNVMVEIDPRSVEMGGSWQGGTRDGIPLAWDGEIIRFFYESALRFKSPRFLDIGANTGSFCLLPKIMPALRGFAFEPNSVAFSVLETNLRLNNISNVQPIQVALSNQPGDAVLKVPGAGRSGLATLGKPLRFQQYVEVHVPVRTLDDFASEHLRDRIHLIKIDAEGCELPILLGAQKLLARDRPDVLCEYNSANTAQFGYHPSQIVNFMHPLGYVWSRLGKEDLYFRHETYPRFIRWSQAATRRLRAIMSAPSS